MVTHTYVTQKGLSVAPWHLLLQSKLTPMQTGNEGRCEHRVRARLQVIPSQLPRASCKGTRRCPSTATPLCAWRTLGSVLEMIFVCIFPLLKHLFTYEFDFAASVHLTFFSNEISSLLFKHTTFCTYGNSSLLRCNIFVLIFGFSRISIVFTVVLIIYPHGLNALPNLIFAVSSIIFTK